MIQRIDELNFSEFNEEIFAKCYFFANRPVVVRKMFLDSKEESWTIDYLLSLVQSSDQQVGVAIYEKRESKSEQFFQTYKEEKKDVREALKLASSDPSVSGKFHNLLEASIPELIEPINIPDFLVDKTSNKDGNLWIGNGNITRLHFDLPNNFYFQIKGNKTFHLFEPANYFYLYPSGSNTSSIEDIENIDFNKFPLAERSKIITIVLEPGDFLYMPPFWWHQVESQEPYISLNYWGSPRMDQVLCYPGYYEFIKHFELGVLIQMYEMCNKTGFEDYLLEDSIQYILYKGYNWAAYILGLSWMQSELLKFCQINKVSLDPLIEERTVKLFERMDKQEMDANNIMFETLGEDRLFDLLVKIKDLLTSDVIELLYKFISFTKAAKNKDNVTITPSLVNDLVAFTSKLHVAEHLK